MSETKNCYAIVVNVVDPQNSCFIVTPYSEEFDQLVALIEDAANQLELQPIQNRKIVRDPSFINDIFKFIRQSKIVVAVCSNEPNTNRPNPNVMYELGIAHSIGKTALIISNSDLPSDIKDKNGLLYKGNNIGTDRIITHMSRLIRNMGKNVLTYPQQDITEISATEHFTLSLDFWKKFRYSTPIQVVEFLNTNSIS